MLRDKVATGRFASPSQVVAEALRLLDEQDQLLEFRKDEIRQEIEEGIRSLNEEEGVDGETFFEQLFAELDGRASAKSA